MTSGQGTGISKSIFYGVGVKKPELIISRDTVPLTEQQILSLAVINMQLVVRMWRGPNKLTTADKYMMADFLTKAGMGRSAGTRPMHLAITNCQVNVL